MTEQYDSAPSRPLAIDLFAGLGGWTSGLLAAGFDVIGFDIERHIYGEHRYPAQLVIQDVLTLHGSQFRGAALIVASPPCQNYSYRSMPWSRAKALPPPDNTLFDACFRIQREACVAAGRRVPMVVENVRGAQKWVGRARWNFGSFYFWGDVPALMPPQGVRKNGGGSWFAIGGPGQKVTGRNPDGRRIDGIKQGGTWFHDNKSAARMNSSGSAKRKAASALIARIPFAVAYHIGRVYHPSAPAPVASAPETPADLAAGTCLRVTRTFPPHTKLAAGCLERPAALFGGGK